MLSAAMRRWSDWRRLLHRRAPTVSQPGQYQRRGQQHADSRNCSGTVTWSGGLGTGASKTVSPTSTTAYTATCTVGGCTSGSGTVTVNVSTGGNSCNGGSGTGLTTDYYNGVDLQGSPIASLVGNIDMFGGQTNNLSGSSVPALNVSARWEGRVEAPASGSYVFNVRTDDGVRVWFNGSQVVDDFGYYPPTDHNFTVNLSAGQKYDIKIEWRQGNGSFEARMFWTYPGQNTQIVPTCRLYPGGGCSIGAPQLSASPASINGGGSSTLTAANCSGTVTWSGGLGTGASKTVSPTSTTAYTATCTVGGCTSGSGTVTVNVSTGGNSCNGGSGTGLTTDYYNGVDLQGSPIASLVGNIDMFGGQTNNLSGSSVPALNVSARWEGRVEAPASGSYVFNVRTDDGVRVWFNGSQVVDDFGYYPPTDHNFTVNLSAGQKYDIKIEWRQGNGSFEARMFWTYPGQNTQIVPTCRLYPGGGCSIGAPQLSASPASINGGGSSTLTAANCSGTITWSGGLGTGASKTVSPASTTAYTATCTVGGCTSGSGSVTVNVNGGNSCNGLEGVFDGVYCAGTGVSGWIYNSNQPNAAISVDIYEGNTLIQANIVAGDFRQDLLEAGKGNGQHAFSVPLPNSLRDGQNHSISIRASGCTYVLTNSPRTANCPLNARIGSEKLQHSDTVTDLRASPNPSSGTFLAEFYVEPGHQARLILSDMIGRQVWQKDMIGKGMHMEEVRLSDQLVGTFIMLLQKETGSKNNKTEYKKIVVVK